MMNFKNFFADVLLTNVLDLHMLTVKVIARTLLFCKAVIKHSQPGIEMTFVSEDLLSSADSCFQRYSQRRQSSISAT